jgi:two-component system, LytTR family, response regulator
MSSSIFDLNELKSKNKTVLIPAVFCRLSDINWRMVMFCEADGSYTRIVFVNKTEVRHAYRIGSISKIITYRWLIRCHRKYIVNLACIKEVETGNPPFLCLENDKIIPISLRKKSFFIKIFGKYLYETKLPSSKYF